MNSKIVTDIVTQDENRIVEKKDLKKVFLRSIPMEFTWNYERQMHLGYCYALLPVLKKLYRGKDLADAMTRHMEFYNTTPHIITFPLGISAAQEEKCVEDPEHADKTTVSTVKTAMMGPIAGIGDSFFWGTLRILATGIGTSLALQGNILGPILYLLVFNVPHFILRYMGTFLGYNLGTSFLSKLEASGSMQLLTYGASIIGLMVAGSMTAEMVYMTLNIPVGIGETATDLQTILDGILPGIMPLALFGLVYWLLKKGVKPLPLTFILMGVGILGAAFGFLA